MVQKDGGLQELSNTLYHIRNRQLSGKLCGYEVCEEEEKKQNYEISHIDRTNKDPRVYKQGQNLLLCVYEWIIECSR